MEKLAIGKTGRQMQAVRWLRGESVRETQTKREKVKQTPAPAAAHTLSRLCEE